ncbi:MAG: UDP-N-acetylglucosamine 1-carboxyvinyltransferase [Candidatus Neomarinimicrobiota bacterium]|nr:MAG: UDP-N-acetylglucosamine 1-carboxyvinyltransferase [Candidatus Neomarinimicrobiota bacterium]
MDKIVIQGGKSLSGRVNISGAKNAVLPIMAAALLVDGKTVIDNVPDLRDTRTMIRLLEMVGARGRFGSHRLEIDAGPVDTPVAPYDLVKTMRASFYVLGPLLSRFGRAKVSLPGGCAWGPRPVDFHLKGLEKLGAEITLEGGYIQAQADYLTGATIHFEIPSVGATGNLLMAAVRARGTTVIENAAREPEIVQLGEFLQSMGARIEGLGTDEITIEGVASLRPTQVTVIPDRIEAGTFLIAGAALGRITVDQVRPDHLKVVLEKLEEAGAEIRVEASSITIQRPDSIQPVNMSTAVYPGFPTDLQAQWIALMALAEGTSIITDTIYHDRFSHVPELQRLGANITLEKNVAVVIGQQELIGAPVMSTDIRASASLILGGLAARGRTEISRVYHIDRGYEKIEEKFRTLGASIERVSE